MTVLINNMNNETHSVQWLSYSLISQKRQYYIFWAALCSSLQIWNGVFKKLLWSLIVLL